MVLSILWAVSIVAWFLWDRFVKSVSEQAKFFVALTYFISCISTGLSFLTFPSISVGLMLLVMGPFLFKRGLDWYRSVQVQ